MEYQLPPKETLPALIRRSLSQPRDAALVERVDGKWKSTSADELLDRVTCVASAIRDAGLGQGDRVALIAADCVNWIVADFATLFAGCVLVPIFPTQAPDQVTYILQNSEAKLIFTDTLPAAERLRQLPAELPRLVVFESTGDDSLHAFEAHGAQVRSQHSGWPEVFEASIKPDDMAVLIYTSGTTGEPKGVMLSHYNIGFNAQSTFSRALDVLPVGSDVLSVLPFSHIYEHCFLYGYMVMRLHHHISHSVDHLLEDLRDVRPLFMTAVPRIFERMLAGITAKAKVHGGLQAKLVPWALETGRRYMTAKTLGRTRGVRLTLEYRLAHALVLRKIPPALGLDRLRFLSSGSAPLHFDTAMTMLGAGIPILEGYGPTECSPVVTVNTWDENHYGTVGKPIPGVEVKLADDGEILVRGPGVMLGYYKNPTATAEVLTDGWYHTGDIGVIDEHGYLHITDRKKELFKTSGGKFVAPSRVEAAIKRSVYINQVMLVGDGRAHPAALVSPNWDLVRAQLGLPPGAADDLALRPDVINFLTAEVRRNTNDLAKFEQVRKIVVLPRELTVEGGELSPTLKVKRRVVEARYAAEIARLYAEHPAASTA
ncbi:MAG TPA: long-chain fatty acid--CoA ligase [Candidatus Baltobacteraceae bacterium]|nr:long-chain fatty acid--CoA ligase [Candidatus Baltobacteraceae bacterium]